MERKSGFYWVKYGVDWEVAFFDKCCKDWCVLGVQRTLDESHFEVINENRIMSPDEWEQIWKT